MSKTERMLRGQLQNEFLLEVHETKLQEKYEVKNKAILNQLVGSIEEKVRNGIIELLDHVLIAFHLQREEPALENCPAFLSTSRHFCLNIVLLVTEMRTLRLLPL